MHISLEDLLKSEEYNNELLEAVKQSGRA